MPKIEENFKIKKRKILFQKTRDDEIKIIENINGRISRLVWIKKLDDILPDCFKRGNVINDINGCRV